MKKIKIDGWEVSELCLGGGKMVDMSIDDGMLLVDAAIREGINIFDCHHRYGNAEEIVGKFNGCIKMTKVSAYQFTEWQPLFEKSVRLLGTVHILWVSDLDNEELYSKGKAMYQAIKQVFPSLHLGITTEEPRLAHRFAEEFPDCNLFMVPLHIEGRFTVEDVAKLKERGTVFAIKPFNDGLCFPKYTVTGCLEALRVLNPDVIVFGTKSVEHLKETVKIWEELDDVTGNIKNELPLT